MIKAIETKYKGYNFRSRLEARWAIFFDAVGIEWEYETEGYDLGELGWYLPDFWLPNLLCWIEIKGGYPNRAELMKAEALCEATKKEVFVFSGTPWFSIARAAFMTDKNGHAKEVSYYHESMSRNEGYDYEQKDGNGCYYQGWITFGGWGGYANIGPLVEGDDVEAAHADFITAAYATARSARFEHGANPQPRRLA